MAQEVPGFERSMADVMHAIVANESLTSDQKRSLLDEVRKSSPALSDKWLYRWVIWFLGATVVLAMIALAVLSALGKEAPQGLVALGSAAAGGLAGLLTPSPKVSARE